VADIARSLVKGSLVADAVNGLTRTQASAQRALFDGLLVAVAAPTNAVSRPQFSVGQATNIEVILRSTVADATVKLWRYFAASDSFVLDTSFGVAGSLVLTAGAADSSVLLTNGACNGFFFSVALNAGMVVSIWVSLRGSDGQRT